MKKTLLFTLSLLTGSAVFAQTQHGLDEKCATMHSYNHRITQNPKLEKDINKAEQNAREWLNNNPNFQSNKDANYAVIPVVVHVVYDNSSPADSAATNIDDSLIYQQIAVLNEDFNRLNADAINTRSVFDSIATSTGIHFCLASVDPQGNPTTGITRTGTTTSHLTTPLNNSVKFDSTGGKTAWPTDQYLNLWVVDMSFNGTPFVLGYAQFPGDDPTTDGVVIQYDYFGRNQIAAQGKGRTATHEVGHYFGMRHIWGDGDCSQVDFVPDTPNAADQSNFDCNHTINSCDDTGTPYWGPMDPPDMVENYMDYSADSCMNMFSKGQATRMWSFLSTDRLSLLTSNGCGTPELQAYTMATDVSCAGQCDGQAEVFAVAGDSNYTYQWDANAGNATTPSVSNLCPGMYDVIVSDGTGATITLTVEVDSPQALAAFASGVEATCMVCNDGEADAFVTGGTSPFTYQWDDPSSQTTATATGLSEGTYTVTVTDACGNTSTASVTVGYSTVGISDNEEIAFSVYPNPASDAVNVRLNNNEIVQVEVYNQIGQQVYSNKNAKTNVVIDVSSWNNGVYFIKVLGNKASASQRVIISQ